MLKYSGCEHSLPTLQGLFEKETTSIDERVYWVLCYQTDSNDWKVYLWKIELFGHSDSNNRFSKAIETILQERQCRSYIKKR